LHHDNDGESLTRFWRAVSSFNFLPASPHGQAMAQLREKDEKKANFSRGSERAPVGPLVLRLPIS
jgi:hypothetical protein